MNTYENFIDRKEFNVAVLAKLDNIQIMELKKIRVKTKNYKCKKFYNEISNNLKEIAVEKRTVILMCLPFILMQLFISIIALNINYINYKFYSVILFDLCWMVLFVGLSLSFKAVFGKIIYIISNFLFLIMFFVNSVYFSIMKSFFDFSLLQAAKEGSSYIIDALKNCNISVYIYTLIIIISIVFSIMHMPKVKKNNYKLATIILLTFVIVHTIVPYSLGFVKGKLAWSNWKNTREIYNTFNDNNKSMKVSGFFEYVVRNFYVTYLKTNNQITQEEMDFLNGVYSDSTALSNKYTSLFKDKNLIIVQLEGMDNWLITKEDTPTLYELMNTGYNFTNHYSFYNGGGSTFNSEFAVNTGFVTPFSYVKNAYTFNKNSFPYSLARMFKNKGYSVNAFHMNTGEYYSREINYLNWDYDNYYGLKDIGSYSDKSYELDRELILNEKFNSLLFPKNKFLDYIITYSGHMPFSNTKGVCKMLYDLDKGQENSSNNEIESKYVSEEQCVRRQAQETDYMMALLLENLDQKDLIDNTALIVFSDHYLYTLEDKSLLDKYKETSNNLINNTPFFIWSKDISKPESINKVTTQLNILPTILNLYGFEYNPNNYIGTDVFQEDYTGIAFFNDYSWYDANVYVESGEVVNKNKISQESLEEKNSYVNFLIRKNDLTLKYNYFKNK